MIDFQGDEIHFQEVNHAVRFGLVQAAVFSHLTKTAAADQALLAQRLNRWPCGFGNGPRRWGP
jgi:hypothetical protein